MLSNDLIEALLLLIADRLDEQALLDVQNSFVEMDGPRIHCVVDGVDYYFRLMITPEE
jgi:hypothetical protein